MNWKRNLWERVHDPSIGRDDPDSPDHEECPECGDTMDFVPNTDYWECRSCGYRLYLDELEDLYS